MLCLPYPLSNPEMLYLLYPLSNPEMLYLLYPLSNPEMLYLLPCDWNYRADHCRYSCRGAEDEGVSLLHGNTGIFHWRTLNAWSVVYVAFQHVRINLQHCISRRQHMYCYTVCYVLWWQISTTVITYYIHVGSRRA